MLRSAVAKKLLAYLVSITVLLLAGLAFAADANPLPGIKDLTVDKLSNLITGIACWTIQIVLAIMVIALVGAGIRFFLARGDSTKITDAKKNLNWVLIGIAVVLATNIIIATIADFMGADYDYIPLDCSNAGEVNLQD